MTRSRIDDASRRRTYRWDDPAPAVEASRHLSGLELLEAIGDGRISEPPALRTLDIRLRSAASGSVVFTLTPDEMHGNAVGLVHGGVIAALLDTAMGCAVLSRLARGTEFVALDLHSQFLRPVTRQAGVVVCTGSALPPTAGTADAVARVEDANGRLMATGTSTFLLHGQTHSSKGGL